jgi:SAM-dependent methyltransferase
MIYDHALDGKLRSVDLPLTGSRRQRNLDVGCGTAIWCWEFAQANPSVDVIGIDLVREAPTRDADIPNVHLITPVDFNLPEWPFRPGEFDFIRNAGLCGSVPDWFTHFRKCF